MNGLIDKTCIPCREGAPLATEAEIDKYMTELPDWKIGVVSGVNHLEKTYKFKNFKQALEFSNEVGALAEQEKHHPAILTEWGQVTVRWWTHKIDGLHVNDFIMAAKTDQIIRCSHRDLI